MRVNYQFLSLALILCVAFLLLRDGVNTSPKEVVASISTKEVPANISTEEVAQNTSTREIVLENIHARTSVRNYSDKEISRDDLTTLVKAGMAAPTAGNMQPWNFLVIDDKETLAEISKAHHFTKPLSGAAAGILVTADMSTYSKKQNFKDFWITDCSVATQNILLAATSMGIGSVWLSVHPFEQQDSHIRSVLDIPENTKILCIVSLGYPSKDIAPKNKWKEGKLSFGEF